MRHYKTILSICASVLLMGGKSFAADDAAQKTYSTPDEAVKALVAGLEKNSDDELLDILGHDNKDLVVQSDKEASTKVRTHLVQLAKEHINVEVNGDKAVFCFGNKCWPYPIPVAKKGAGWYFDTAAGKEEILNRRIGRNELAALRFVDTFDDAQRLYASVDRTGDKVLKYAQRIASTPGKKDGLYWPGVPGALDSSPLAAVEEDGKDFLESNGVGVPYKGYYYKILTKQGSNAPNGKYDYVINGNMIAGFALVAWPADYGASGIMTFVISHQGITYQKDLGADTAKIAGAMDEYNPDDTWKEVKPDDK